MINGMKGRLRSMVDQYVAQNHEDKEPRNRNKTWRKGDKREEDKSTAETSAEPAGDGK